MSQLVLYILLAVIVVLIIAVFALRIRAPKVRVKNEKVIGKIFNEAMLAQGSGEYEKAIVSYTKAGKLLARTSDRFNYGLMQYNIGNCLLERSSARRPDHLSWLNPAFIA